jgi:hypothetical protein
MKAQVKTAIAMFGGATALALTVGFGGLGVSPLSGAPTATTHASSSAMVARPGATAPAGGTVVHTATLAACVSGLDC